MEVWQIWGIIGIALIIVEMFTPVLFFLNLAFAAIITGAIEYFMHLAGWTQVTVFAVLSILFLVFLRPLLAKDKNEPEQTGVKAMYYGQTAKVVEKITASSGRIHIYGEAWNAKTEDNSEIEENSQVKILYCKDLTMYVEKIEQ